MSSLMLVHMVVVVELRTTTDTADLTLKAIRLRCRSRLSGDRCCSSSGFGDWRRGSSGSRRFGGWRRGGMLWLDSLLLPTFGLKALLVCTAGRLLCLTFRFVRSHTSSLGQLLRVRCLVGWRMLEPLLLLLLLLLMLQVLLRFLEAWLMAWLMAWLVKVHWIGLLLGPIRSARGSRRCW